VRRAADAVDGWSTRRREPHQSVYVALARYQPGRSLLLRPQQSGVVGRRRRDHWYTIAQDEGSTLLYYGYVQPNFRVLVHLAGCHEIETADRGPRRARTALSSPVARIRVAMALREEIRGGRAANDHSAAHSWELLMVGHSAPSTASVQPGHVLPGRHRGMVQVDVDPQPGDESGLVGPHRGKHPGPGAQRCFHSNQRFTSKPATLNAVVSEGVGDIGTHWPISSRRNSGRLVRELGPRLSSRRGG
jgi:hypothetical protein